MQQLLYNQLCQHLGPICLVKTGHLLEDIWLYHTIPTYDEPILQPICESITEMKRSQSQVSLQKL